MNMTYVHCARVGQPSSQPVGRPTVQPTRQPTGALRECAPDNEEPLVTHSLSRHRPAVSGAEWITDEPADAAAFRCVRRSFLPTLLLAPHSLIRGRTTDQTTRGDANGAADAATLAPAHESAHEAAHLAALAPTDRAAVVHPADPRAHACALGAPHHADGNQPADEATHLEAVESPQWTGTPPRDLGCPCTEGH